MGGGIVMKITNSELRHKTTHSRFGNVYFTNVCFYRPSVRPNGGFHNNGMFCVAGPQPGPQPIEVLE